MYIEGSSSSFGIFIGTSASLLCCVVVVTCLYCFKSDIEDDEEEKTGDVEKHPISSPPEKDIAEDGELWGKVKKWFSKSEEVQGTSQELPPSRRTSLYDRPPMGTLSIGLVQPPSRQTGPTLPSTSEKRESIISMGVDRSRLGSYSYVPEGFKAQLEYLFEKDEEDTGPKSNLGKLYFSINYIFPENTLLVKIIKAVGLPAMDLTGTSDPFVKCCLLPDRKRKLETKIRRKTLNPTWNETFSFEGLTLEKIKQRVLFLQVLDYDRFSRNDPIGEIYVALTTVDLSTESTMERPLQPCQKSNKRGELFVSLCYEPVEGELTVGIIKGKNLKPMDLNGTSDPYVKIWLVYRGKRVEKKKTVIVKNSLDPTFGEEFSFSVPLGKLREIQLEIVVMDYDVIGRNDTIGKIYLGNKSAGLEKQHWKDMLSSGRKPVSQWHVLKV